MLYFVVDGPTLHRAQGSQESQNCGGAGWGGCMTSGHRNTMLLVSLSIEAFVRSHSRRHSLLRHKQSPPSSSPSSYGFGADEAAGGDRLGFFCSVKR